MSGGPRWFFNGKEIPCYIGSSPKAYITSTMLTDMLKTMDSFNVFDQSNGKKPLILFGALQQGDYEAQNGSISMGITKTKEVLHHHIPLNNKNFTSSNIILFVS